MIKKIVISSFVLVFSFSLALPTLAEESVDSTATTTTTVTDNSATTTPGTGSSMKNKRGAIDLACAQTAVDARETALIAAWDTFGAATKTAWETRKADLKAAWALTDKNQRNKAIGKAMSTFEKAKKTARRAYDKTRIAEWVKFEKSKKACRVTERGDSQGKDSDGKL